MNGFLRTLVLGSAIGIVAAATYVATAVAGAKPSYPLTIDPTNRTVSGGFGSVRNTADGNQFILCSLTGSTTSGLSAACWAHDSSGSGAPIICQTTNSTLIGILQKIPPDAYVSFAWDTNGNCTSFNVGAGSTLEPKKP